ncbi:hypothetical protein D3C86_1225060 [compost metagenome]
MFWRKAHERAHGRGHRRGVQRPADHAEPAADVAECVGAVDRATRRFRPRPRLRHRQPQTSAQRPPVEHERLSRSAASSGRLDGRAACLVRARRLHHARRLWALSGPPAGSSPALRSGRRAPVLDPRRGPRHPSERRPLEDHAGRPQLDVRRRRGPGPGQPQSRRSVWSRPKAGRFRPLSYRSLEGAGRTARRRRRHPADWRQPYHGGRRHRPASSRSALHRRLPSWPAAPQSWLDHHAAAPTHLYRQSRRGVPASSACRPR